MAPVIPAPEDVPVKRGRPTANYKASEVVEMTGIPRSTLYAYAAENKVPCSRIGGRIKFPRARVDAWMKEKGLTP